MKVASLCLVWAGLVIATIAMAAVGRLTWEIVVLVLSPYVVLFAILALVHKLGSRHASQRALLVTSILLTAATAWAYVPLAMDPGGCMTGLAFLLSLYFLLAVPLVFGAAYVTMRAAA